MLAPMGSVLRWSTRGHDRCRRRCDRRQRARPRRGEVTDELGRARDATCDGVALSALYPVHLPALPQDRLRRRRRALPSVRAAELCSARFGPTIAPCEQRSLTTSVEIARLYRAHARGRSAWLDRTDYIWERIHRPPPIGGRSAHVRGRRGASSRATCTTGRSASGATAIGSVSPTCVLRARARRSDCWRCFPIIARSPTMSPGTVARTIRWSICCPRTATSWLWSSRGCYGSCTSSMPSRSAATLPGSRRASTSTSATGSCVPTAGATCSEVANGCRHGAPGRPRQHPARRRRTGQSLQRPSQRQPARHSGRAARVAAPAGARRLDLRWRAAVAARLFLGLR